MNEKLLTFAAGFVVASVLCGAVLAWKSLNKPPAVAGETPAEYAEMPTELVDCRAQVLPKKAKEELRLPAPIIENEQERVIAVAHVPQVEYPQLAGALLNISTGEGRIYFTPQDRPWVAFNRRLAVGVAYSVGGDAPYRLYGRWDLVQIKRLHFGVLAELYDNGKVVGSGYGEFN